MRVYKRISLGNDTTEQLVMNIKRIIFLILML
jgi:hypothetical protein